MAASFKNVISWFLTRQRKWVRRARPSRAMVLMLKLPRVKYPGDTGEKISADRWRGRNWRSGP